MKESTIRARRPDIRVRKSVILPEGHKDYLRYSLMIDNVSSLYLNNYNRLEIFHQGSNVFVNTNVGETITLTKDYLDKKPEHKVIEAVENFLYDSKICKIENHRGCLLLDSQRVVFEASNGRKLETNLDHDIQWLRGISWNCRNSYLNNRFQFCEDNKDVNYLIYKAGYDVTSFDRCQTNTNEDALVFNFSGNHYVYGGYLLEQEEREFIKWLTFEKLNEQDDVAKLVNIIQDELDNTLSKDKYLICGNLKIQISKEFEPKMKEIVDEYNRNRESAKKMQLKLEEF